MTTDNQRADLLSVVVIGRNEGERLARCLDSIAHMHHPGFDIEVIYVDSGSTDASLALAEARGARVIALRPERPTAALGRNAGWREARGATVLFLDGDTILDPSFVSASLADLARPQNAVVWGHRREIYPEHSIYNRVLDLDWIYAPGPTLFCGGDALFHHSALAATGGYDDTLIAGEEPELCRRIAALGHTILHVDRAMTGHDLAITRFRQYWKRSHRAGHAYAEVSDRLAARGQTFWADEAIRNRNRAFMLISIPIIAILLAVTFRSFIPVVLIVLFYIAIGFRSAYKARWKSSNKLTLLLYGIHSHFAQIPIYIGQLAYKRQKRKGQPAALVEYK